MRLAILFILALICCGCDTITGVRGVSLYVTAAQDRVYNVDKWTGTNWTRVSNFIGNGTNSEPELIVTAKPFKTEYYRFRPEMRPE